MEAQFKSTMRYHHTAVRKAEISKTDHIKHWQGRREREHLLHCWWKWKLVQPLSVKVCQFTERLNLHRLQNPDATQT